MSRHHSSRAQRAARAALAPSVDAGTARCRRCGELVLPGQLWDAGHLDDLATGGATAGPMAVEHARRADCSAGGNRSAGATLGNQLRAGVGARRRVAAWLELEAGAQLVVEASTRAAASRAAGFFGQAIGRTTPRVFVSPTLLPHFRPESSRIDTVRPQIFRCEP